MRSLAEPESAAPNTVDNAGVVGWPSKGAVVDGASQAWQTSGLAVAEGRHGAPQGVLVVVTPLPEAKRLDSYDPERRSSVQRNVDRSLENGMNDFAIVDALGLLEPSLDPEEGWDRIRRAWSDDPADVEHRRHVARMLASQSMEFWEHSVEYGYSYTSGATVDDGSPEPTSVDPIRVYQPSTRPGSPLPHAWLDTPNGDRVSALHLIRPGRFLLIAGEDGLDWCDAATSLATKEAIPVDAVRVGHLDGNYRDPRCRWLRLRQIGPTGALLVRPDRFVAWRKASSAADPVAELAAALDAVLGRSVTP